MSCLGVLFAIDGQMEQKLLGIDRSEVVDFLQEEIEEVFFTEYPDMKAELDKSWDAIHRAFSNSTMTFEKKGDYPLNHVILGASVVYGDGEDEDDYVITINPPEIVKDVYEALSSLTESGFREKYFSIDPDEYGFPLTDEDFGYSWEYLESTLPFWKSAAEANKYVVFSVDQ